MAPNERKQMITFLEKDTQLLIDAGLLREEGENVGCTETGAAVFTRCVNIGRFDTELEKAFKRFALAHGLIEIQ